VCFDPNEPVENILARGAAEKTTLTAFFAANADSGQLGVLARQYTYQEFPQYLTFSKPTARWTIRKQGNTIGRIIFISPAMGELFYLRTLLCVAKGPRSFEDVQSFNGCVYPTY
jgi:hypothetical protein